MAIRLELEQTPASRLRLHRLLICISTVLFLLVLTLSVPSFLTWRRQLPEVCAAHQVRPHFEADPARINERHTLFPHSNDTLFVNATLIDGDGTTHEAVSILLCNATIVAVGSELSPLPDRENITTIVNLKGKYVTPGLVDMHSHFGTRIQPQLKGTEDTNEFTSPITPFVRSIDGIDSQDPELKSLAASGVTTHLVLTGSKNLISGESYAVKMHASPHNLVDELLVQYGMDFTPVQKPMRWFKMAYGENEKQTGLPGYPVSRIGAIWRIREAFDSARSLLQRQDRWCSDPHNWNKPETYPEDIHLDTLASILRGDINMHIHLYEAYDFESIIRVADEFGIHISAFHHALSGYKIPSLLKSHNATIALFADEWGGKKEMYDGSVHGPRILEENDIPVALKTDHPALPGQQLLFFAQIAHHYGLKKALQSVTSVPAENIGLGHRLGYVRPGYDADLVIWDRHPLTLGVTALETVVDGVPMFEFANVDLKDLPDQSEPGVWESKSDAVCDDVNPKKIIIKGLSHSVVPGFVKSAAQGSSLTAVIDYGEVVCVGTDECLKGLSEEFSTVEVTDGYLVPGVTSIGEGLGLREMVLEDSTGDGEVRDGELVSAADGIHLDGLMVERLNRVGITQGVTAPMGTAFTKGYSTHFRLSAASVSSSIIQEKVAVHFNVGNGAKSITHPTISSQIASLREFLTSFDASIPVAVHTHNAGVISQVVRLAHEFPEVSFIVVGGQEAHLVADELAEANVSVVLSPWRCTAKFWDNRHCSNGWPLERPSVDILHAAGVQFAVAYDESQNLRRVFWEAGEAASAIDAEISLEEQVQFVSGNIEAAFGVQKNKDVLVWEHDPFKFGATLAMSVEGGELKRCYPDPEEANQGDMLF